MKKLFIVSLIALSTLSYGRVVSRPRPVSRPRVSSTRSYSKPKTTSFSSTSTIKPKTSSSLISTTPKLTTVKKSLFNNSNDNYNNFSSSGSSYSNSSSYYNNNNSGGFGLFDFLLLNSLLDNSHNTKVIVKDEHGNELTDKKMIIILEQEIKEEKNKFEPNKEKIKQYEELIKKLKKN